MICGHPRSPCGRTTARRAWVSTDLVPFLTGRSSFPRIRRPAVPSPGVTEHPMSERLRAGQAQGAGVPRRVRAVGRAPARQGQDARPRADRATSSTPARSTSSTCSPATGPTPPASRSGPYTDGVITGWGTVDGRKVFVFSPGLHRVRRRARRGVRREDPQADGPRAQGRRAGRSASTTAPAPASRRASCRLASYGGIFYRNVLSSGVDPADLRDPRARAPAAPCTRRR